ncbi:hypothetical protein AA0119_g1868 [Alternaria tenuissima]|uniref:Uncharacterized protein n=1 Tax=Alternaria tenuissima TaxID=119927 RepID=A0ABY0GPP0_9PLEO|nr:hypothetical protein AA0119_g1868 [Alternaria tenuissima]
MSHLVISKINMFRLVIVIMTNNKDIQDFPQELIQTGLQTKVEAMLFHNNSRLPTSRGDINLVSDVSCIPELYMLRGAFLT